MLYCSITTCLSKSRKSFMIFITFPIIILLYPISILRQKISWWIQINKAISRIIHMCIRIREYNFEFILIKRWIILIKWWIIILKERIYYLESRRANIYNILVIIQNLFRKLIFVEIVFSKFIKVLIESNSDCTSLFLVL